MEQPTIDAGRLRLRPFTADDIDWVHQVALDPLMRTFIDLPSPYRREHAEHFVERLVREGWATRRRVEYLAEDAATGERLGRAGLSLKTGGAAEVGYWVDPAARGRGVATTAVTALCGWAFATLGLGIVHWRAEVGNDASRRVAEKAGFRVEATLRQRVVHRGQRVDAWLGSMLPEELCPVADE
ncbi:GNAT family N-acetyltransferase [Streptomyces litchfieldiae]|uniref:GNAT family protein n=1 Tax=Streptomyces litchfieldiae TaxID=3075543 RepID=A0ABU2MLS3_9ACTN|nr:GNAT family protein [Streptomyces sp. DSM 44938]MDT0341589.1 GNAT family protein [Streptomyces sp. DSM 44938]